MMKTDKMQISNILFQNWRAIFRQAECRFCYLIAAEKYRVQRSAAPHPDRFNYF